MRQATPCPTVLSAPDQRLKTTPTFPGWMIVKDAHTAATTNRTSASMTPLASAAGVAARYSSVMAILPLPVAPPLEHDDAAPPGPPRREPAADPDLEPAAEGTEEPVEQRHQHRQHEHLAHP